MATHKVASHVTKAYRDRIDLLRQFVWERLDYLDLSHRLLEEARRIGIFNRLHSDQFIAEHILDMRKHLLILKSKEEKYHLGLA